MRVYFLIIPVLLSWAAPFSLLAQETPKKPAVTAKVEDRLVPLNRQKTVMVDLVGKRVLLKTKVVQREALLEFFCCLSQTKEHESILSLDAKAFEVHAALLRIEAEPGRPVEFQPTYKPPTGHHIDIFLQWRDKKNKLHRVRGQEWVQSSTHRFFAVKLDKLPADLKIPDKSELRYDKFVKELLWFGPMSVAQKKKLLTWSKDKNYHEAIKEFYRRSQPKKMEADWVFAGSLFIKDELDGKEYYLAEDGQLISLANFPSATIDIALRSSDAKGDLLYEAATEKIPPLGTEVIIELIPKRAKKPTVKKPGKNAQGKPASQKE